MIWSRKGLVFDCSRHAPNWGRCGALTPTPVLLDSETIRVFCGFRNDLGISQIGYVDFNATNPTQIIRVSQTPVLELGVKGTFDDNGQILGHIEKIQSVYHLYYIGFQLVKNVKFLAFTGLATSHNLRDFKKYSEVPVLDRSASALFINAIHSCLPSDQGGYDFYFASGSGWQNIDGRDYPRYSIFHTHSIDGVHFQKNCEPILNLNTDLGEYRIGRPSAFILDGEKYLFYTKGGLSGSDYIAGLAKKLKGKEKWERLQWSPEKGQNQIDFDSRHVSYPRILTVNGRNWVFYNGNDMGKDGIGLAELKNVVR